MAVGEPAVRREHRVGALAADGQGRAFYMADHLLQHVLIRAVCDGKPQIQLRDLDITHHAIAVEVEQRIVFRLFRLSHHGQRAPLQNAFVKRLRLLQQPLVISCVRSGRFFILIDSNRLRLRVQIIGDGGIEHDAQPQHKDQHNRQHR